MRANPSPMRIISRSLANGFCRGSLERERLIISNQRILRIPDLDALKAAAEFDARYLHLDGAPPAVRDALSALNRVAQVRQNASGTI